MKHHEELHDRIRALEAELRQAAIEMARSGPLIVQGLKEELAKAYDGVEYLTKLVQEYVTERDALKAHNEANREAWTIAENEVARLKARVAEFVRILWRARA